MLLHTRGTGGRAKPLYKGVVVQNVPALPVLIRYKSRRRDKKGSLLETGVSGHAFVENLDDPEWLFKKACRPKRVASTNREQS